MSNSEKEKMLAGELYNCLDSGLTAERNKAKRLFRQYNMADEADRQAILSTLLGHIGQNSAVEPPFFCSYGRNISIGNNTYLNFGCTILDNNTVRIGQYVMIGPSVQIYTAAHPVQAELRITGLEWAKPVTVEDKAWIGGGAIILPGVTIGHSAVVGAGSVVTRDVPPDVVVAGNPARVIGEIER